MDMFRGFELSIVSDNACLPSFSVTAVTWSDVPPLCPHAPVHARRFKQKCTVSRWDGDGICRRRHERKEQSLKEVQDAVRSSYEEAVPDSVKASSSPRKPSRKASIDFVPTKTSTRQASITMPRVHALKTFLLHDGADSMIQKPMRKASLDFSFIENMDMMHALEV